MTGWKLSTAISPPTSRAWRPLWTRPSCPTQSSRVSFWRPKNSWHWWMWNTPRPLTDVKFSLKWTCLWRRIEGHSWIRYSHHPKVQIFKLCRAPNTVLSLTLGHYFFLHFCKPLNSSAYWQREEMLLSQELCITTKGITRDYNNARKLQNTLGCSKNSKWQGEIKCMTTISTIISW